MSPPSRRLTFAVGTSLLTASLSLGVAACTAKSDDGTKNGGSKDKTEKPPDPDHQKTVNEGPEPDPEPIHTNAGPEPVDEPVPEEKVNTGPVEQPPPDEPDRVNVARELDPEPEPKPEEPKHVNVRADSK